jgi:hypothetical protein
VILVDAAARQTPMPVAIAINRTKISFFIGFFRSFSAARLPATPISLTFSTQSPTVSPPQILARASSPGPLFLYCFNR